MARTFLALLPIPHSLRPQRVLQAAQNEFQPSHYILEVDNIFPNETSFSLQFSKQYKDELGQLLEDRLAPERAEDPEIQQAQGFFDWTFRMTLTRQGILKTDIDFPPGWQDRAERIAQREIRMHLYHYAKNLVTVLQLKGEINPRLDYKTYFAVLSETPQEALAENLRNGMHANWEDRRNVLDKIETLRSRTSTFRRRLILPYHILGNASTNDAAMLRQDSYSRRLRIRRFCRETATPLASLDTEVNDYLEWSSENLCEMYSDFETHSQFFIQQYFGILTAVGVLLAVFVSPILWAFEKPWVWYSIPALVVLLLTIYIGLVHRSGSLLHSETERLEEVYSPFE